MQSLAIILFCIAAAVTYGIVHDQITARICVEYFTIGHPPVFNTTDPTLLGLGWGVIATWWAGLMSGIPLACAARVGKFPQRSVRHVARPIGMLLLIMATIAICAGISGWLLANFGYVTLRAPYSVSVPITVRTWFIADEWAHTASYFVGFVGGIVLTGSVLRSRYLEWKAHGR